MKALFLAASAIPGPGKTKISFRDINGGDENNDFRSGSNTGVIPIDVYGDNPFEIGKTYLMEITEFVPADETAAEPAAATEKTDTAADEPQSIEFEGKVKITTLGNAVTISVESSEEITGENFSPTEEKPAAATEQTQEEQTNTQEVEGTNPGANGGTGVEGMGENGAAAIPAVETKDGSNTQAGPGAGPTGGDNIAAENVVNETNSQTT